MLNFLYCKLPLQIWRCPINHCDIFKDCISQSTNLLTTRLSCDAVKRQALSRGNCKPVLKDLIQNKDQNFVELHEILDQITFNVDVELFQKNYHFWSQVSKILLKTERISQVSMFRKLPVLTRGLKSQRIFSKNGENVQTLMHLPPLRLLQNLANFKFCHR